jgi:hypothetical protein
MLLPQRLTRVLSVLGIMTPVCATETDTSSVSPRHHDACVCIRCPGTAVVGSVTAMQTMLGKV